MAQSKNRKKIWKITNNCKYLKYIYIVKAVGFQQKTCGHFIPAISRAQRDLSELSMELELALVMPLHGSATPAGKLECIARKTCSYQACNDVYAFLNYSNNSGVRITLAFGLGEEWLMYPEWRDPSGTKCHDPAFSTTGEKSTISPFICSMEIQRDPISRQSDTKQNSLLMESMPCLWWTVVLQDPTRNSDSLVKSQRSHKSPWKILVVSGFPINTHY